MAKRVPENAPGDFYVEEGMCMRCCLVHGQAPELLNDPKQDFRQCYFRRQPQTPAEIDAAIRAIQVSETAALRYGGTDQTIIRRLGGGCCDHVLQPEKRDNPPMQRTGAASIVSLVRKLLGRGSGR